MRSTQPIKKRRTRAGVHPKGVFGGGIDPAEAARKSHAARYSPERRALVALAQEARPEAFGTVLALMRDPLVEAGVRLAAARLTLEYSDGKPRQAVDITVGPRDITALSREQLEAIAAGAPAPFELEFQGRVIEHAPIGDKDGYPAADRVAQGLED